MSLRTILKNILPVHHYFYYYFYFYYLYYYYYFYYFLFKCVKKLFGLYYWKDEDLIFTTYRPYKVYNRLHNRFIYQVCTCAPVARLLLWWFLQLIWTRSRIIIIHFYFHFYFYLYLFLSLFLFSNSFHFYITVVFYYKPKINIKIIKWILPMHQSLLLSCPGNPSISDPSYPCYC